LNLNNSLCLSRHPQGCLFLFCEKIGYGNKNFVIFCKKYFKTFGFMTFSCYDIDIKLKGEKYYGMVHE